MAGEKILKHRCSNCNQQLLEDEIVCWQCGYHLYDKPVVATQTAHPQMEQEKQRASATIIYGGQTVLLVLTAVLLTYFLGSQPRVRTADVPLPEGWEIVADQQRNFTLYLPQNWERLDAGDEQERAQITEALAANTAYRSATKPFGDFVPDEEIVFLARESAVVSDGNPGFFLVVTRSAKLNQLTPEEAVTFAQEGDVFVLDAQEVDDYDKSHVALNVEMPDIGQEGLFCRQQFTTGEHYALLFALCHARGPVGGKSASTIMGSFQRLAP